MTSTSRHRLQHGTSIGINLKAAAEANFARLGPSGLVGAFRFPAQTAQAQRTPASILQGDKSLLHSLEEFPPCSSLSQGLFRFAEHSCHVMLPSYNGSVLSPCLRRPPCSPVHVPDMVRPPGPLDCSSSQ
jgi:hypothetical protein